MRRRDLGDEYLAVVQEHLEHLKLRNGELTSGGPGKAHKSRRYLLHRVSVRWWTWGARLAGLFEEKPPGYTFELHPAMRPGTRRWACCGIGGPRSPPMRSASPRTT
jgi:hypothetical protein